MITHEELERDRQDVINQLNRLQGALSYVNQKIAAMDKLKKEEEEKEEEEKQEDSDPATELMSHLFPPGTIPEPRTD